MLNNFWMDPDGTPENEDEEEERENEEKPAEQGSNL